ncbi:bifunctional diaminohydroxyphosphoribosylaminopyrimidine deaminase/5-amino-6-(5-phosphoribosylamino)uracil reductase RibD [Spongiactinospora sp. TRM90649]|uniref:bifunctional diaminohydroxyphosphoribosylaminopyrimidine deaminase/5-amino-6-(5-phosphoribosylamino)uracil reductase RibD n=1 Tax=Spongiactinospora sp. TRM90649 TaxID=3031114 RepID=UPI0023F92ED6|nr:bifunctional diaminohydroxyphosphoribosylaminopyrimidine deaminase/5-amino-6-(5-phosphoribosylamino)uracil reductase RibD [Spongiactinospora sp. TRM90649]MDF5756832.1 bifunctional diaminohydroxyphosphoribosylaminopyrimidine deaminase/5-amino-6-(5-phosphoribosylamino)uracil reductase RibD [Spongiactinospora sp. TRM90649]
MSDLIHMRRAIELAAGGLGTTSPNPVVGCVILDSAGQVAGEGFHAHAGGPHAEVAGLAQAGARARGGTAYVSLEPCDHTGRTGPCTLALLRAGVRRVVVAATDPNPVASGGSARLRANGVVVEIGLLEREAEAGNAEWLVRIRHGRPHVTWKFAATLDGRSAAADGTSKWITSPEARADVHRLRARSDAVVAGIGTVLADDPLLTARPPLPRPSGPPLRVVVDSEGRTPPGARVLSDDAPTLVAVAADAAPGPLGDAEVLRLPRAAGGRLDLRALLTELHKRDIVGVFLEGGPVLAGSFMEQGLIDRVVGYLAPALLGAGAAALGPAGVRTIGRAHRLVYEEVTAVGPDLRVVARPAPSEEN